MSGPHGGRAKPLKHGLREDALEPAAVNADLRHREAGGYPARPEQDLGPQPVGVAQFSRKEASVAQLGEQPEFGEFPHHVGQQVDADTQLVDGLALLVDNAVDAHVVQPQRRGKSADARANDQDPHGFPSAKELSPTTMTEASARGKARGRDRPWLSRR